MSDSSENPTENDDEPVDPRIPIELERANAATSEINNLELQLSNAQKLFHTTFHHSKQDLSRLAKNNARAIERARPFYQACQRASQAQRDTQQAAQEYQYSVECYHTAEENLILAQDHVSKSNENSWQEYISHAQIKIKQAEEEKRRCEKIHEEKSKLYQEIERERVALSKSLKKSIFKSKPYFDLKRRAEEELKKQKVRIEDVQKAIRQAKATYRTALNNLEQISEEIHSQRQRRLNLPLPPREPTIGSEQTNSFIEIPSLDFTEYPSDGSSDTELSTPIHSMSIQDLAGLREDRASLSHSASFVHRDPSSPTQINENAAEILSKRMTKSAQIPLLSHLQSYPSDSSLYIQKKS